MNEQIENKQMNVEKTDNMRVGLAHEGVSVRPLRAFVFYIDNGETVSPLSI